MKKLLTLFALLMGVASGAWADAGEVTTNVDIDFSSSIKTSNSSPKNIITGTIGTMKWDNQWTMVPNITDGILRFGNFTGSVALENNNIRNKDIVEISFEMALSKLSGKTVGFSFKDKDGGTILSQTIDAYNGGFAGSNPLNLSWDAFFTNNTDGVLQERCIYFTITIDYKNNSIKTHTRCYKSGTSRDATEMDFNATLPSTNPIGFFELTGNINNTSRYSTFDNLLIKTTEGDYSAATADYIVEYKLGDVELKSPVTRNGDIDASINLVETDKSAIWVEGVKYIYSSDNSASKTISSDGSTVVTVVYREANTYSYTLKSSIDNAVIGTKSAFEGERVSISYPNFIVNEGTLYSTPATSSEYKKISGELSSNTEVTLTYTATEKTNVVYYSEGEDVSGATTVTNGGLSTRCSNAACGVMSNAELTTLPAGVYAVTVYFYHGNSSEQIATLSDGTNNIASFSFPSQRRSVTKNVVLYDSKTLYLTGGNVNNNRGVDLIYIQRVGDVPATVPVTIGQYGYATYVAPYNMDFSGSNITAYTVSSSIEDDVVTITPVEDQKVPAGTAVVLKGTTDNINVIAEAVSPVATDLTYSNETITDATKAANTTYYYLGVENGKVVFRPLADGGTLAAGKCFFTVDTPPAGAKSLRIALDDDNATGVTEIESNAVKANGKFIENGQIIIVNNGKKYNVVGIRK